MLSQELEKANAEVLRWFDTERARQRALLDEKSQLRRHLAMQKVWELPFGSFDGLVMTAPFLQELWDQQYDELVESLIKQYYDAIDFMTKSGFLPFGV